MASAPHRIALLHPTYWPEVRRGSERLVHDLGVELAARGQDVTLITSHRGPRAEALEDGVRVVRVRRPRALPPLRWYEDHLESVPAMLVELVRGGYEIAHAFYPSWAWAAVRARPLGAPPVVFSLNGIPVRRWLVGRRYRLEMLTRTLADAAAVTVLSRAAATVVERYLRAETLIVPGGVRLDDFDLDVERGGEPTLLCAASLADPRKGGALLLEAFSMLRRESPAARLRLVRTPDPQFGSRFSELPAGAEWVDVENTADLAREFASAWASVLPAIDEAFGLVLIESLAAGTPVVALRSGACPEIVTDPLIGALADPGDAEALRAAMAGALELAADPATRQSCRDRVAEYSWQRLAGDHERIYQSVLDR